MLILKESILDPYFTLIVPIFNGEAFLSRCLDSVIEASKGFNIEMILVDDGSTDNSINIAQEYSNRVSWIISIQQKNGGPSSARNTGLKLARGEYIGFVDCDDCISDSYFSELSIACTDKPDIVVFGYQRVFLNGRKQNYVPYRQTHNKDLELLLCNVNSDRQLFWFPPTKLFKASVLSAVSFDEYMRLGEDTIFNLQAVYKAQSISRIDSVLYFYYETSGSLSSSSYKENLIENMERHFSSRLNISKNTSRGLDDKTWQDIYNYYIFHILPWLLSNARHLNKSEQLEELKRIRDSDFIKQCYAQQFRIGKKPRMALMQILFRARQFGLLQRYITSIYSKRNKQKKG